MDDMVHVGIFNGLEPLLERTRGIIFIAFKFLDESASWRILHEQEDVILVREVGVELDDVGVVEPVLYLQLVDELAHHLVFHNR
jgi:hypothetical protein